MSSKKVLPLKKRFHPNLSLFILILIILYVGMLVWGYFSKPHISIYEVNNSEISDDTAIYGYIMRTEEVVKTSNEGYINYYNKDGNRIGKNDVVYTIDTSGKVSSILNSLQSSTEDSSVISDVRNSISNFQNSFSMSDYSQINEFASDVNGLLFKQNGTTLYSKVSQMMKAEGLEKDLKKVTAKKTGVISYVVDGYEGKKQNEITEEILDSYGKESPKQLTNNMEVRKNDPAYKLVTDNTWSLIVKLTDDYYNRIKKLDSVRINISKDNISFNASVELYNKGKTHFGKFTTQRFMERYINDRFLKIEFNIKSSSGLKIPNTSILKKNYYEIPKEAVTRGGDDQLGILKQVSDENGNTSKSFMKLTKYYQIGDNYYLEESTVSPGEVLLMPDTGKEFSLNSLKEVNGVYLVNEGYCKFKPIDILYQNKEYTIIADNTVGGLMAYDHIVVDAKSIKDNEFIE